MNIYLDESYNLQKDKGKMFISINGFVVLNAQRLRKRWKQLKLQEYKNVKIIIDSRKHLGGALGAYRFQHEIEQFLKKEFSGTHCLFLPTPSYLDILVELADFVSNTFYKSYQKNDQDIFNKLEHKLIQIKNPL